MSKISDYKVIKYTKSNLQNAITDGWIPFGGIALDSSLIPEYQGMIKYIDNNNIIILNGFIKYWKNRALVAEDNLFKFKNRYYNLDNYGPYDTIILFANLILLSYIYFTKN